MNIQQKWKSLHPSTRVAVAAALGLSATSSLLLISKMGPILVAIRALLLRWTEAGINVPETLATAQLLLIFAGIAILAALHVAAAGSGISRRRTVHALVGVLLATTSITSLLLCQAVAPANPRTLGADIFMSVVALLIPLLMLAMTYGAVLDSSSSPGWSAYGLSRHFGYIPATGITLVGWSMTTAALLVGLWLMLILLPKVTAPKKETAIDLSKDESAGTAHTA